MWNFDMILLDLFSGIGGFHLGLTLAGFKFDEVYYSEIDKYAMQIYKRNFPNAKELGSITGVSGIKADIITFGFPCQDLSIAGRRDGLGGSRSSLFFEAIRIIQDSKPDYFIFENVKGLFSSNNGKDFDIVLRAIADIGYDGQWQLLNTRWFLPQNRERIYFVGYSRNRSRPEIFPIGENNGGINEGTSETANIRAITGGGHSGGMHSSMSLIRHNIMDYRADEGFRGRKDGNSPTLQARARQDYSCAPMIQTSQPRCGNPKKGGTGTLESDKFCFTIGSNPHLVKYAQRNIRRLTPTECERLQGFPDGWTEGVSDTQRYKTLGNAVSVPVVKAVGKKILDL